MVAPCLVLIALGVGAKSIQSQRDFELPVLSTDQRERERERERKDAKNEICSE